MAPERYVSIPGTCEYDLGKIIFADIIKLEDPEMSSYLGFIWMSPAFNDKIPYKRHTQKRYREERTV